MSFFQNLRQQASTYIVLFALALTFMLTSCSTGVARGQGLTNAITATPSAPSTARTPPPTTPTIITSTTSTPHSSPNNPQAPTAPAQTYGTDNGCPSNVVVSGTPAKASIILHQKDAAGPITAHVGDLIEFQLPFGQKWSGPLNSEGNLTLQLPFGYASAPAHACIWRFSAKSPGITNLSFYAQMLCKPGSLCAMYVLTITFTIKVQ